MVVEDNAELRQFICEILSGTYRVVGVADGVMALEKIEEEIPDFYYYGYYDAAYGWY